LAKSVLAKSVRRGNGVVEKDGWSCHCNGILIETPIPDVLIKITRLKS